MSKRNTTRTTPSKKAPATHLAGQGADQVDQAADQVDPYPLSRRATPADVAAAGIRNGMSAEEIEAALTRVMA